MKKWRLGSVIAAAMLVVACGGGGGDPGTTTFGKGEGIGTGGGGGSDTGSGISDGTDMGIDGVGKGTSGDGVSEVSSGVPSQKSISISVETYALNWSADGEETKVTVRVTDTAGNPVPEGSEVQLSTEGGQIQKSCLLSGVTVGESKISACSVTFATQNRRPNDGFVSILAWMEGEEAYVDANGNGKYDTGEPFWDAGRLFRDDNESGVYEAGTDELNVGNTTTGAPGVGSAGCASPASHPDYLNLNATPLSVPSSCDGVWGKSIIRTWAVLPVSDPRFLGVADAGNGFAEVYSRWGTRPTAAPAETEISVQGAPDDCTVTVSPAKVPEAVVLPTLHRLTATGASCTGASVTVVAKFGSYEANSIVALP